MNYFQLVLEQIFQFVIYMAVGIIGVKTSVFNEKSLNSLSLFIIKISLPVMLFINTLNGVSTEQLAESGAMFILIIVMYIGLALCALILVRIFELKDSIGRVYTAIVLFGNIGFIGIPIINALFPENGMLYIAVITAVNQTLIWTVGVILTSPSENNGKINLKKMINPSTVATLLAFIGIFLKLKLPVIAESALSKIGATTTPLAMIYLGGIFCYMDIRQYLFKKDLTVLSIVKMFVFPMLFWLGLHGINISEEIKVTITIISGMPAMTALVMMAKTSGSEGDYTAGSIFVTTIWSIITIPAVCYLIQYI